MKKIFAAIVLSVILISLNSCNGKQAQNPVPSIPFNVEINITFPLYDALKVPMGGIVFYQAGSKGLAILRVSDEQFVIFDRHCPYKVEEGCAIVEDPDNIASLVDESCCGSRFNMINAGIPDDGPANIALKSYNYTFNGSILRVYN